MMADISSPRDEALRLAVELYSRRLTDDCISGRVLQVAGEFTEWLTARPVTLTVGDPVISEQANSAKHFPLVRTGENMAVTMTDTQKATYPAPNEADSKGFPITGDAVAIAESSGGAVVALTVNPDGTSVFSAVAPGAAQISWTDGTVSFADTINVTPGGVASIVVGPPVIEEQAPPAPPAP
jgi:hypothetical protein